MTKGRGVAAVVGEIILIAVTVVGVSVAIVVVSRYSRVEVRPDVSLEVSAWENDANPAAASAGENDFLKLYHRGREPVLARDLKVLIERITPDPTTQIQLAGDFSDNLITTGETVYLRCTKLGGGYFNLRVGDYLRVTIAHAPSGSLIFDGKVLVENAL